MAKKAKQQVGLTKQQLKLRAKSIRLIDELAELASSLLELDVYGEQSLKKMLKLADKTNALAIRLRDVSFDLAVAIERA